MFYPLLWEMFEDECSPELLSISNGAVLLGRTRCRSFAFFYLMSREYINPRSVLLQKEEIRWNCIRIRCLYRWINMWNYPFTTYNFRLKKKQKKSAIGKDKPGHICWWSGKILVSYISWTVVNNWKIASLDEVTIKEAHHSRWKIHGRREIGKSRNWVVLQM